MPGKLQKGSIASELFETLLNEVDDWFFICSHPHAVFYTLGNVESARTMLIRKEQKWRNFDKRRIHLELKRLHARKLIQIRKKGDKLLFSLTCDGIQEALKQKIRQKKQKLSRNLNCYVSFDIPKHSNNVRWALRQLLKNANFRMIHQSLWCSNKNVGKEIAELVKILKAEGWIHVFEAIPLTNQSKHKK